MSDKPSDSRDIPVDDRGSSILEDGLAGLQMPLLEHLSELRSMLVGSLAVALVAAIVCWFFSAHLLEILIRPMTGADQNLYFHQPVEAFLTRLKLAFVCGLFLVLPYLLYRVYGFINPGLYKRERKVAAPLLIASVLLFYTGVGFAYLVLIPQVVSFLLSFSTESMLPLIGIGPYFAFVARLCLAFGLVFQLPLVVLLLSVLDLVNPKQLLKAWRYAFLIIVVAAAILTPPDAVSQLLMAVPVSLLYICSVLIAMAVNSRRRRKKAAEQDREED